MKYIVTGKTQIDQIRALLTSIEFDLTPERDHLNFNPDLQNILLSLFHIREKTAIIEGELRKQFPDRF